MTTCASAIAWRYLENMTWEDVARALDNGIESVVVPVGSFEQHGPHLPLNTDSIHTLAVCERVAEVTNGLIAPLVPFGVSPFHMALPGTITMSSDTLSRVLADLCGSLALHGFKKMFLYSGHGGNAVPLGESLRIVRERTGDAVVIACDDWSLYSDTLFAQASAAGVAKTSAGGHAGELEASMLLHLAPDTVRMARAAPGCMDDPEAVSDAVRRLGIDRYSSIGVIGDPRGASAIRGRDYVDALSNRIAEYFVAQLEAYYQK